MPTVLGRDAELRDGAARLDEVRLGPHSILLTGPAGIGKTSVWQALVEGAGERAFRVLAARAGPHESTLAFSGLTDLLSSVLDHAFEALPSPQRSALRVATLRDGADRGRHDQRAVAAGTLALLRALSLDHPVLLAVDDLQWIDAPTAHVIEYAVRRLTHEPVGLLATLRDDGSDPEPATGFSGADHARTAVLRLGPLDDPTVARLVTAAAAGAGAALTLRQQHHLTRLAAGNPLFARELARSGFATSGRRLPLTLQQLVEDRIRTLPATTRSLLLLAATIREPTVPVIAAAYECGVEQAYAVLEPAAETGVLAPLSASRTVLFSHPIYQVGVGLATTAALQREAHRRAASVALDAEEVAGHLALAAVSPDAGLAARLDSAATRAVARGAPEAATDLARHALRLTPDAKSEDAYRRAITVAELAFHAGQIAEARGSLETLVLQPAPPALRARALRALGELESHQDSNVAAIRRFSQALDLDPEPDTRSRLLTSLAYSTISNGDFRGARRHALAALALVESIRSPARRAVVFAVAAISAYLMGEVLNADLVRMALLGEDPNEQVTTALRPSLIVGHLWLYTGRLTEAVTALTRVRDVALASGNETDLVVVSASLAWANCWHGQLAQARSNAAEALAVADRLGSLPGRCIAASYGAVPYAFSGDLDRAERLATEGLELADSTGFATGRMWASWALIVTALESGRPESAMPIVEPLLEVVDTEGLPTPVRVMALADAVEVLIGTGDLARARHYQAVLEESASRTSTPWAQMQAHRCAAMCAAASGNLPQAWLAISDALRFTDKHEHALESARTRLVAGQIARRRRQRREARTQIELALDTFAAAGARTWTALAQAELDRTVPHNADGALTATETRIARLAADGRTNQAVATMLNISPKTVEANLARVYRKLGIHSRAELGALLGSARIGRLGQRDT